MFKMWERYSKEFIADEVKQMIQSKMVQVVGQEFFKMLSSSLISRTTLNTLTRLIVVSGGDGLAKSSGFPHSNMPSGNYNPNNGP